MNKSFREAVFEASRRADVRQAVGRIYADLQAEIDRRRPVCVASGRCCKFDEFGHRLFITTAEMATFVHDLAPSSDLLSDRLAARNGTGCPFQKGKLCSVHAIRPFGCRIFFCDATATEWQQQQYQRFHARLKRLHDDMHVPYFYAEWRQALRELEAGFDPPSGT